MKSKILVVDDEESVRFSLKDILEDEDYEVFLAEDREGCFEVLKKEPIDVVILDVWLGKDNGIDLLKVLKEDFPNIEVIIISGHSDLEDAVKAIKIGAFDMIEKPFSMEKLLITLSNSLLMKNLKKENRKLKDNEDFVGYSKKMRELKNTIRQYAKSNENVFIFGENGSGKEMVSREIYRLSKKNDKEFIAINCAAIPESLIEAELFGYEKGAFTGATSSKKGKFEIANGGIIFLDEIADLSLEAQAKVLRVIQNKIITPIGSNKEIKVDVRIISATNKDIAQEIKNKRFREDLYYRLFVLPIFVPPLRERKEDIVLLIKEFLRDTKVIFSQDAIQMLESYSWPGNVRQLKNVINRLLVIIKGDVVQLSDVKKVLSLESSLEENGSNLEKFDGLSLQDAREEFEKNFLQEALKKNKFNLSKTAKMLGIYPSNLSLKMKKFNIQKNK